jgi:hypothetical protein
LQGFSIECSEIKHHPCITHAELSWGSRFKTNTSLVQTTWLSQNCGRTAPVEASSVVAANAASRKRISPAESFEMIHGVTVP